MAAKPRPIPEGYTTVTPHLVVKNGSDAIAFYKKAFGAVELHRMPGPDGKGVMHAALKFGNAIVMLAEECPEMGGLSPLSRGGTSVTIHLYVENTDATFKQAVAAGAKPIMPPADMFWGDRYGKLTDPSGHEWSIATHTRDMTPEQMQKEMKAMMANAAGKK